MNNLLKNILRFILLVFLQVFVLNHILVQDLIVPCIYILFLLLLPKTLSHWGTLICGFLLGFTVDLFMNTGGMYAAACVFLAFLRPTILNLFVQEKEFDSRLVTPSVRMMGWIPFLSYALILTFIYHTTYFSLEVFDFSNIFYLSLKILYSTGLTLIMIVIFELLFSRGPRRPHANPTH